MAFGHTHQIYYLHLLNRVAFRDQHSGAVRDLKPDVQTEMAVGATQAKQRSNPHTTSPPGSARLLHMGISLNVTRSSDWFLEEG